MPYHTILVHADDAPSAKARFAGAIALARACQAHLIGLGASGISRGLYPTLPPEQSDPTLALHLGYLREQAQGALTQFARQCEAAALPSFEARLIDDETAPGLALFSRTADLTILSQSDPERNGLDKLPADVVLQAGGPVLLVPFATPQASAARPLVHAVVAWDASREAARALQLALPLLALAQRVTVAIIDTLPPGHVSVDARLADPLPWLARHGIEAALGQRSVDGKRHGLRRHPVGEALLSLVGESGADLLVMGAYAHSRMRETLLGGVTRTVFESMTVPVLMAH